MTKHTKQDFAMICLAGALICLAASCAGCGGGGDEPPRTAKISCKDFVGPLDPRVAKPCEEGV